MQVSKIDISQVPKLTRQRHSKYDPLIDMLATAKANDAFVLTGAKPSEAAAITQTARRRGIPLAYVSDAAGKLYLKLLPEMPKRRVLTRVAAPATAPVNTPKPQPKPKR